jgi:thiopurine S-methyltransferase
VNPLLERNWPRLDLAAEAPVFVPLCGKSLDMHWLHDRGHPVTGVELSPIAIREFYEEAGMESRSESHGALDLVSGGGFELYRGDLFELTREDLARICGVYDRACLIALPPSLRSRYAEHLIEILPEPAEILLITIEHDQTQKSGSPHSAPLSEIDQLFGGAFTIDELATSGVLDAPPHFQERGLVSWQERVQRLARRPSETQRATRAETGSNTRGRTSA